MKTRVNGNVGKGVSNVSNLINEVYQSSVAGTANNLDVTNLVSLGSELENSNFASIFYNNLFGVIGKTLIAIRPFERHFEKDIVRESLEFGEKLRKVSIKVGDAIENPQWVFEKQKNPFNITSNTEIRNFLYGSTSAYSYENLIPGSQIRKAFFDEAEVKSFIDGLYIAMNNKFNVSFNNVERLAVATGIAVASKGVNTKIKLLTEYNELYGTSLTPASALINSSFLSYSGERIRVYIKKLENLSTQYNVAGWERHTSRDFLVLDVFSQFIERYNTIVASNTFHKELINLPSFNEITFWQQDGSFSESSKINITLGEVAYDVPYVLAYAHDRDAVGCAVLDERVPVHYNEFSDVVQYGHQATQSYYVDDSENGVIFVVE